MYGYTGKSLRIDLTGGSWEIFDTPEPLCNSFLGGRGFGVELVRDHITKSWDSEEMPLILATGPLVGTIAPTSGRLSVISKSPLTATVFDCSVGGRFATELKKAGLDMMVIRGISRKWVTVHIDNMDVHIRDAADMTGLNGVFEVE